MTQKNSLFFLIILIIYSFICLVQLGVTWDTFFYYEMGKDRLDYLFSLGKDESFKNIPHSKYLPGAYSTLSAFFSQFFSKKYLVFSLYSFNFIFSFFALIGIYKVSKILFNKFIGKITFLICFFNPIYFGHMSINSNDTIISFTNIWFSYLLLNYFMKQDQKEKSKKYIILSGICLGLGLGVRSGFVITIIPLLIFGLLSYINSKSLFSKKFIIKKFLIDSSKVLLISYCFMIFFWPHTHQNIFMMPFKLALEGMSYGFGVPYIMLNEVIYPANEFPKNYILKNLIFKLPEYILVCFIIFLFIFYKISNNLKKSIKSFNLKIFFILFIIIFPNILLLISPYSPYDGLRFFLYLMPYISIIPSILLYFLYKNLKINIFKAPFFLIILLIIFFGYNFFSLTPYHYVYLNLFAGKNSTHSKKFENDYWGITTKKLISKIKNNEEFNTNSIIKFTTCGLEEKAQIKYLKNISDIKFKMVKNSEEYDFIIMNNRISLLKSEKLNDVKTCFKKFEGKDVLSIERRNVTLSKITKRVKNEN